MDQLNLNLLLDREKEEKLLIDTLQNFETNKSNKLTKRGIYIYGDPGSGKSVFVKNILKKLNYDIILYDAGDIRNKSIIENITKHNMSDKNVLSLLKKKKKNIAIIMDEIDGMNNGDKGGITSLIKLIRPKKTKKQKKEDMTMIPIICIGNYHTDKKIKELMKVSVPIEIKRPCEKDASNFDNPKKSRKAYSIEFKLKLIEEAKKSNNNLQVGKKHLIHESNIRSWRRNEEKIRSSLAKITMEGKVCRVFPDP